MCANTGTFYCFNLLAIVIVTVYMLQASQHQNNLQRDIDFAHNQGNYLSCVQICPIYPYQQGDQCCTDYYRPPCQYRQSCLSEYIASKQNQLAGVQTKFVYYLVIDVLLVVILVAKICRSYCKRRDPHQQDLQRRRALLAMLFAARQHAANLQREPVQIDRSILTQSFIAQDRNQNCAICLDAFEQQRVVNLNCSHLFHRACIQEWLNKGNANCPVCRAPQ